MSENNLKDTYKSCIQDQEHMDNIRMVYIETFFRNRRYRLIDTYMSETYYSFYKIEIRDTWRHKILQKLGVH